MTRRHILFIAPSAYHLGGVAVWLDYLLPGLRELGWNVVLGLTAGQYHSVGSYLAHYPGIGDAIGIHNPTGSRRGRVDALTRFIREQEPDLVVSVNIPDVYDAVNEIRSEGKEKPRVAMALHGVQQDLLDDAARYRDVLDGVVGTNRLTVRLLEQISGIAPERIGYAPYGVPPVESRPRNKGTGQVKRIAWVGRIEQAQKRALDLPDILDKLDALHDNYTLVIAGEGPETPQLRQALSAKGVAGRCDFLGMVPPENMIRDVYQKCDMLLVTSLWETGPIIIWEAMAHGVPVVSSRYIGSGLEAGLHDGENCLLFDISDTHKAAQQIGRLMKDQELVQQIISGGHELVAARYSREVSIHAWHETLADILDRPLRPAADLPPIPPAGRLDRLLGTRRGERLRRWLGLRHRHVSAGGEWPHTVSKSAKCEDRFWAVAKQHDRTEQ